MKIALSLILTVLSFPQLSLACDASTPEGTRACLEVLDLANDGPGPDCAPIAKNCQSSVQRLVQDGVVNVTMAQGYSDFNGTLDDHVVSEYVTYMMADYLTKSCPSYFQNDWNVRRAGTPEEVAAVQHDINATKCGDMKVLERACGFTRTDDPEILIKHQVINGKTVVIKVRIVSAALTVSDKENRQSMKTFVREKFCASVAKAQQVTCISTNSKATNDQLALKCVKGDERKYQVCRSDYAKKVWRSSINQGDEIVYYSGHARKGGGPSFEPPRVLANGHVDYPWYQKVRPGHTLEAAALRQAAAKGKAPVFYGSFSCNGIKNFYEDGQLPEASLNTSYVLSHRVSFTDESIAGQLALLEGAFNGKCGSELDRNIQQMSCAFNLRQGTP